MWYEATFLGVNGSVSTGSRKFEYGDTKLITEYEVGKLLAVAADDVVIKSEGLNIPIHVGKNTKKPEVIRIDTSVPVKVVDLPKATQPKPAPVESTTISGIDDFSDVVTDTITITVEDIKKIARTVSIEDASEIAEMLNALDNLVPTDLMGYKGVQIKTAEKLIGLKKGKS